MKTLFNLTTSREDLDRYQNGQELLEMLQGFDGLELMHFEADSRGIIPKEKVIGLHMRFPACWLDFWRQDEEALLQEFGSLEDCEACYGGLERETLCQWLLRDLEQARNYDVEYLVFHAAECSAGEAFTQRYRHSDEEVIRGLCEILNQVFTEKDGPLLLLENLWHSGFRFTRPEITKSLLDAVNYPRTGIMLDTGHLLHTKRSLRSPSQAVEYIHSLLDAHGELCQGIHGVHLNLSLSGDYAEQVMANPPRLSPDYMERSGQVFSHIFRQDQHRPFLCPELEGLLRRIAPQYLTYEFISDSKAQHREFLTAQRQALAGLYASLR
ncbi:MAG: TIM barrel protein [Firmicutes bacterium]|nr:TIM barrel protein [Bacillota bacterium]